MVALVRTLAARLDETRLADREGPITRSDDERERPMRRWFRWLRRWWRAPLRAEASSQAVARAIAQAHADELRREILLLETRLAAQRKRHDR